MNPWPKYAFFRLLFPYVIGILLRIYLPNLWSISPFLLAILLTILIILSFLPKLLPYRLRTFYGVLLFFLMLLGAYHQCDKSLATQLPDQLFEHPHQLLFKVIEEPLDRKNSKKLVCLLKSSAVDSNLQTIDEKVILYIEKDTLRDAIRFGDYIIARTKLQRIKQPLNPHEFNYKKYLEYHRINAQVYLRSETFKIIPSTAFSIQKWSVDRRNHLVNELEKSGLKGDILAVATAILLGYDELLDPNLQQQFSAAGAMHVLCVSGLHVGVIYLLFNSILAFLLKFKGGRNFRAVLVLCIIWMYALITGLSPSVLRASCMLSFIIVGEALGRKGNVYNSMAASAFVLLLYSPLMITEIGFQLSYAAVLGIVSLHKPIKSIWLIEHKILDKIWSVGVISIAAQLGTFPLAIYYFHQFPTYFLLSNLLVVFLAGFIINVGFGFIILMKVPLLSLFLSKLLGFLILILNTIVQQIELLPSSIIAGLVLNLSEMVLIYLILISIYQTILTKLKAGFVFGSLCLLLLLISFTARNISFENKRKMVFYQINKHLAIDFINDRKNILVLDSLLSLDQQKINYHILNNQFYEGVRSSDNVIVNDTLSKNKLYLFMKENWIQFHQYRIWIADKQVPRLKADFVVMRNNPKCNLELVINQLQPKYILIYSNNYPRSIEKWCKIAQANNMDVYLMKEKGAFIFEF